MYMKHAHTPKRKNTSLSQQLQKNLEFLTTSCHPETMFYRLSLGRSSFCLAHCSLREILRYIYN